MVLGWQPEDTLNAEELAVLLDPNSPGVQEKRFQNIVDAVQFMAARTQNSAGGTGIGAQNLFVAPGTYSLSSGTLSVPPQCNMKAGGSETSTVSGSGQTILSTVAQLGLASAESYVQGVIFDNTTLPSVIGGTTYALNLNGIDGVTYEDCTFQVQVAEANSIAVLLNNCTNITFRNCTFIGPAALSITGASTDNLNFNGCEFFAEAQVGVSVAGGGADINFDNCQVNLLDTTGVNPAVNVSATDVTFANTLINMESSATRVALDINGASTVGFLSSAFNNIAAAPDTVNAEAASTFLYVAAGAVPIANYNTGGAGTFTNSEIP